MIVSKLHLLASAIESRSVDQPGFDMKRYAVERGTLNPPDTPLRDVGCNTFLCLAGWTCWLFKSEVDLTKNYRSGEFYWKHARDILDMTDAEADSLFLGGWTDGPLDDITAVRAVQRLRSLAAMEEHKVARAVSSSSSSLTEAKQVQHV